MTSDPRPDRFGNTRWFLENFLFGTSLAACTVKRRLIIWQRPTRARTNPGTARARRLIRRRPEHARADPSTTTRGEWREERRGGLTREWREAGRVEWPGGEYLIILGPKWTEPVRSDPVRSGIYSFSSNLTTNDICVVLILPSFASTCPNRWSCRHYFWIVCLLRMHSAWAEAFPD